MYNINNNNVSGIKFESGRIQTISNKTIINGENDWNKVQVTTLFEDVSGLSKVKEYSDKSFAVSAPQAKAKAKVLEKVKRAAATDGCHMLLIISFDASGGGGFLSDSRASLIAAGYKY